MSRRVLPYEPGDEADLELTPQNARDFPHGMQDSLYTLRNAGTAFTLFTRRGEVLAIVGIARIDPTYGVAWGYFGALTSNPAHLRFVLRVVREHIDARMGGLRRLEVKVREDFPQALNFAHLLGFVTEGVQQRAAADGGNMVCLARLGAVTGSEA